MQKKLLLLSKKETKPKTTIKRKIWGLKLFPIQIFPSKIYKIIKIKKKQKQKIQVVNHWVINPLKTYTQKYQLTIDYRL